MYRIKIWPNNRIKSSGHDRSEPWDTLFLILNLRWFAVVRSWNCILSRFANKTFISSWCDSDYKRENFHFQKVYFLFFWNFSDSNIWSEVIYRGWVHFWRLCKPLKMKLKCQKRCGQLEERLKDRFICQVEKILYRISSGELKQMIFIKLCKPFFWLFSFYWFF